MADEFISFDKVLRELQMQEEELKRLVSEGEIRAFRDQDKMKFKKEDVDRFRKGRATAKDETMGAEVPEELVFDEDDANQEVGMATAAISDDSFLEEEQPKAAPAAKSAGRAGRSAPAAAASGRKPRATSVQVAEEKSEGIALKLAILLSSIVLIMGMFVAMDATKATPSGLTRSIADMFKDKK